MKFRKTLATILLTLSIFFVAPVKVEAQQLSVCTFIGPICDAIGVDPEDENIQEAAASFVETRASFVLALLFIGITVLAVFIIISAGIKYIQSQGEETKIEEANKAIKSVFAGIAILIVGVVGVFLIFIFFNIGDGFLTTNPTDDQNTCFEDCTADNKGSFFCTTECADGIYGDQN